MKKEEREVEIHHETLWIGIFKPLLKDNSGNPLEYCVMETAYSMETTGDNWVELKPEVPTAGDAGITDRNAVGYVPPTYSLDGKGAVDNQSEVITFADSNTAEVVVSNVYTTCLTVTKEWEKGVDTAAISDVTVQLYQDGVEVSGAVADLTDANPSYTFEGLETGHNYSAKEVASPPNYTSTTSGVTGEDGFFKKDDQTYRGYYQTITNTYNLTKVTVKKVWSDGADAHASESITIKMKNEFNDGDVQEDTLDLSASNNWEGTFENVKTGGRITVEEVSPPSGYIIDYGVLEGDGQSGYTQTITNYKDTREFKVTKVWDNDEDPNDNNKPGPDTEVSVKLYWRVAGSGADWVPYNGRNNGTDAPQDYTKDQKFISKDGYEFTNLEYYAGGLDNQGNRLCYEYYARETAPLTGNYLVTEELGDRDNLGIAGSETITNTFAPKTGLIKISKIWSGDAAANAVRPQRIRVQGFYRVKGSNDEWQAFIKPEEGVVELSDANHWMAALKPYYEDSNKKTLEYCVMETAYSMETTGDNWVDLKPSNPGDEATDPRNAPGYGAPTYSLNGEDPTDKQSGIISFTESENMVEIKVSNTYTTCFTVTKVWEKGVDSLPTQDVRVQLYQDDKVVPGAEVTLTADKLSHTFEGLEIGHDYSAEEVTVPPNYSATTSDVTGEDGFFEKDGQTYRGYYQTITNTYQPTTFTVEKIWSDGPDGHDPITVKLTNRFSDGRPDYEKVEELSEANGWKYTFTNLEVGGKLSIEEVSPPSDYTVVYGNVQGDAENGFSQTITNYNDMRSFKVNKVWDNKDDGALDKPGPNTEVSVQLYWRVAGSGAEWTKYNGRNNGTENRENYTEPVSFISRDGFSFSDLEVYAGNVNRQGTPLYYEYHARETAPFIDNYIVTETVDSVDDLGIAEAETITNTFAPRTGLIRVFKVWSGDTEASGVRPQKIRVQGFYRVKDSNDKWQTFIKPEEGVVELSAANRWMAALKPYYENDQNEPLEYCVMETAYSMDGTNWADLKPNVPTTGEAGDEDRNAPGYAAPTYSLEGGDPTDKQSGVISFTPAGNMVEVKVSNAYTTTFTVTKEWQYPADQFKDKDLSVTVQLQADGKDVPEKTRVLTKAAPSYIFDNLETGPVYTVREVEVPQGFDVSYSAVEGEDGYSDISIGHTRGYYQKVLNAYREEPVPPTDKENPKAGDNTPLLPYVLMALVAAAGVSAIVVLRRREKRKSL